MLFDLSSESDSLLDSVLAVVTDHVSSAFRIPDPYHGPAHAQDVVASARRIGSAPEVGLTRDEQFIVAVAAALHDAGYAAFRPEWSQDRREHVYASLASAAALLPTLPVFASQPVLIELTLYLIAYHDDTNYKFPTLARGGEVVPVALGPYAVRLAGFEATLTSDDIYRARQMLNVLREADAVAATDAAGAERTFHYSVERGVPVFAPGDPLNAWAWEESAIGNVRIAARRLLIDAISADGRQAAKASYASAEAFVENVCLQHGVPYVAETARTNPEVVGPLSQPLTEQAFRITRYMGWEAVEAILRDVRLNGDRSLRPYADAQIRARRLRISGLRPTAFYALNSQLDSHRGLQLALERDYALSLFDLSGALDYTVGGQLYRMGPPLVETYFELTEGQVVSAIVDGLHRVILAKSLGHEFIWAVEITGIPPRFPLVPLPLHWTDIRQMDTVPTLDAKRRFRFGSLADFPDISDVSSVTVTEENYRYFFYRDLSPLGSPGIRQA